MYTKTTRINEFTLYVARKFPMTIRPIEFDLSNPATTGNGAGWSICFVCRRVWRQFFVIETPCQDVESALLDHHGLYNFLCISILLCWTLFRLTTLNCMKFIVVENTRNLLLLWGEKIYKSLVCFSARMSYDFYFNAPYVEALGTKSLIQYLNA